MKTFWDEREDRREALLEGISQRLSYADLAAKLGVRRDVLIQDVRSMRRRSDRGLFKAQRIAKALVDKEKKANSVRREEKFFEMSGMTFREKTFQNMVYFYRPELLSILSSNDREAAIRDLPKSVIKTLKRNGILINRGSLEISKQAKDEL